MVKQLRLFFVHNQKMVSSVFGACRLLKWGLGFDFQSRETITTEIPVALVQNENNSEEFRQPPDDNRKELPDRSHLKEKPLPGEVNLTKSSKRNFHHTKKCTVFFLFEKLFRDGFLFFFTICSFPFWGHSYAALWF